MATQNATFADLNLIPELLRALELAGYNHPTEIQMRAIPPALAGSDMLACAQTGTGKTAAFALPILQKLQANLKFVESGEFRALILAPTRELVEQICENARAYAKFLDLKCAKIYGGVSQNQQIRALEEGIDLLVATPGRLLDIFRQKKLSFKAVEYFVLDEADRMLDMGFIRDIRQICRELPSDRQSLLFSATLSGEVQALASFAVKEPVKISANPESPTVEKISQRLFFVAKEDKIPLLKEIISKKFENSPEAIALVFCRTKHGANRLARQLAAAEFSARVIHANKSQSARRRALQEFKDRVCRVLIATDIAARGIDVKAMPLVVNFDLPEEPETYIHRIGRTARAEAEGEAVSLCSEVEVPLVRAIERLIRRDIPRAEKSAYHCQAAEDLKDGNRNLRYRRGEANSAKNPKQKNSRKGPGEKSPRPAEIESPKPANTPRPAEGSSRAQGSAFPLSKAPETAQSMEACRQGQTNRPQNLERPQKSAEFADKAGEFKSRAQADFRDAQKSSRQKSSGARGKFWTRENSGKAGPKFQNPGGAERGGPQAESKGQKRGKGGGATQGGGADEKFSRLLTRSNESGKFHSTKSNPAKFQIPWMVRKRILKAKGKKF